MSLPLSFCACALRSARVTHDTVQNRFLRPDDTGQEIGISEYSGDLLAWPHIAFALPLLSPPPSPSTSPTCSSRLQPLEGIVQITGLNQRGSHTVMRHPSGSDV